MRFFFFSIPLIMDVFTLSSCITSLQNLATYENIVTDNRITGVWTGDEKQIRIQKLVDSKLNNIFKEARTSNNPISERDSIFYLQHYIITYGNESFNYIWSAAFVNVGGSKFINLSQEECNDKNDKKAYLDVENSLNGSIIAKFEWKNQNTAQLQFLNGDYIKEIILAGKIRIKHEYDPLFGTFIITASSKELEQFLEKYGHDDRLYKGGSIITLERKN